MEGLRNTMKARKDIYKGYVNTTEGQIHYRSSGDGEPLVLLHCTSDSSTMWEAVLPIFGELGYRAIALDIPGHGNSDPPREKPDGTEYARRIDEAAQLLKLGKYSVLGHHFGATVAEWVAVNHANNVKKCIFYGLPILDEKWQAEMAHAEPRRFDRTGETMVWFLGVRSDLSDRNLPLGQKTIFDDHMVVRTMIAFLQAGSDWHYAYNLIGTTDHVELGKRIKVPVLFMCFTRDTVPIPIWQEKTTFAETFPDWIFTKVEGGVDFADECPHEFCRIVDEFIRSKD